MSFNAEYIAIVVLSALCIGFVIVAVKKRHDIKKFFDSIDIKNRIKQLILLAEAEIVGTKKGQERLFYVCSYVWQFIPPSLKPFITVEMLVTVINMIFSELAEHMDDGSVKPINKAIP